MNYILIIIHYDITSIIIKIVLYQHLHRNVSISGAGCLQVAYCIVHVLVGMSGVANTINTPYGLGFK